MNVEKIKEILTNTERIQHRGDYVHPKTGCCCAMGAIGKETIGFKNNGSWSSIHVTCVTSGKELGMNNMQIAAIVHLNDRSRLSFEEIAGCLEEIAEIKNWDDLLRFEEKYPGKV